MIAYVIRRTDRGGYVAKPGSKRSYTRAITSARVYTDRDAALRDCCVENEAVVPVQFADFSR